MSQQNPQRRNRIPGWAFGALLLPIGMALTPAAGAESPAPNGPSEPTKGEDGDVKAPAVETDSGQGDANAAGKALTAIIRQVRGNVQVRPDADAKWVKAKVGMRLTRGAEFRTGLRSQVAFAIPPGEVIALDRLGRVQLIEAVRIGNKVKTDIGMPYGRAAYTVEAAGVEHESTMHMPGNTLAIRGTRAVMFAQRPFPAQVTMMYGTASFTTTHRGTIDVSGYRPHPSRPAEDDAGDAGQVVHRDAGGTPTTAMLAQDHAVTVATGDGDDPLYAQGEYGGGFSGDGDGGFLDDLSNPIVCGAGFPGFNGLGGTTTTNNDNPDPVSSTLQNQFTNLNNNFGTTDTEDGLKITFPGSNPGGNGGFELNNNPGPLEPPVVEGILDIMLAWNGDLDLDLLWRTPGGFEISPSPNASRNAAMTSPDGGRVDGEDHGGPNGMERIVFDGNHGQMPPTHPAGNHVGTVLVFDGQGSATFNLHVTRQFGEGHHEILADFHGTLDPEEVTKFAEVIHVPEIPIHGNSSMSVKIDGSKYGR